MTFDDLKWATRELLASLKHREDCDCRLHGRLAYQPRQADRAPSAGPTAADRPTDEEHG